MMAQGLEVEMRAYGIGIALIGLLLGRSVSAQSFDPCKEIQVIDAAGRLLGSVIDQDNGFQGGRMTVYTRLGEAKDGFFALQLAYTPTAGSRLSYTWVNTVLYYETFDCSGQAYAPAGPPFGSRLAAIRETTLYTSAINPPVSQLETHSHQYLGTDCGVGENTLWVVPVNPLLDLDDHYTPPFRQRCQE